MTSKQLSNKAKNPLADSNELNQVDKYLSQAMSPINEDLINKNKFNVDDVEVLKSPVIVNPDIYGDAENFLYSAATKDDESKLSKVTKFPDSFNPRKESNMHHTEKVNKWIINVPNVPLDDEGKFWENNCYDPSIASADIYEDDKTEGMDLSSNADVIEFQSRKITFLVNKAYYSDYEKVRKEDGRLEDNYVECKAHHPTYEIPNFPNVLNCSQYKPYNLQ